MGWMNEEGDVNLANYEAYVASTRLAAEMADCPEVQECSAVALRLSENPNEFFADMDCGGSKLGAEDDEDDDDDDEVALSRKADKKGEL